MFIRCISIVFLLLLPTALSASNVYVEKHILENGLTVLIEPIPSIETVSIYAYVRAGSATEGAYLGMGISHFVEHMLFKGTSRRAVGEIAKEVRSLGGNINAHTSLDYTMYTVDLPKAAFKQGIDIVADMLSNSVFDVSQVESERTVIHGEMDLYADRPERVLSNLVFKHAYLQHPYRHPIIGYRSLFDQITRDQLYQYYKSHYAPNNIILSIAGNVNHDEALALVKQAFKDAKPVVFIDRNIAAEPTQISPRSYQQAYATNLHRFSLVYQGVGILDDDLYAMDVLAMALGQGESSRLYKEVYQRQGLVNSIAASNFTPQDQGLFEVEVNSSKDNAVQVIGAIKTVIMEVRKRGLSSRELAKTKRQVMAQFIFNNQSAHGRAYRNAVDEGMAGDINFSRNYVEAVKKVTNKDIMRVANQYLKEERSTVVVLAPARDVATVDKVSAVGGVMPSFEKVILPNGLTVLLQENHHHPTINLQLVMNAGSRHESKALNGLSALTAQVWGKATKTMDVQALADELEGRAIGLNTFAGRNSLGIKMGLLSEDINFGLNILLEMVERPVFDDVVIEQERQRLLASIEARMDDVPAATFKELLQALFLTHPFRLDPLGDKESVAKITKKDIVDYYRHYARPSNMVLSLVGDFNAKEVVGFLRDKFILADGGGLKLNHYIEQPPQTIRRRELFMNKDQAMLALGFMAPAMADKDRWGMEVLDAILGSSLSGRLFIKVRDKLGKAYTVGSSYVPGIDAGMFGVHVLTSPDKVQSIESIIWQEINLLQAQEMPAQELSQVKDYLKGAFAMGLDSPSALAAMSSFDELYGLGFSAYTRFNDHIDAVTAEDIQRLARQYLDSNKAALVITNGKKMVE